MTVREAFETATPYLREFRAALDAGRFVICGQCVRFRFAADPLQLGQCEQYTTEAFPFVPFQCSGFERRQRSGT